MGSASSVPQKSVLQTLPADIKVCIYDFLSVGDIDKLLKTYPHLEDDIKSCVRFYCKSQQISFQEYSKWSRLFQSEFVVNIDSMDELMIASKKKIQSVAINLTEKFYQEGDVKALTHQAILIFLREYLYHNAIYLTDLGKGGTEIGIMSFKGPEYGAFGFFAKSQGTFFSVNDKNVDQLKSYVELFDKAEIPYKAISFFTLEDAKNIGNIISPRRRSIFGNISAMSMFFLNTSWAGTLSDSVSHGAYSEAICQPSITTANIIVDNPTQKCSMLFSGFTSFVSTSIMNKMSINPNLVRLSLVKPYYSYYKPFFPNLKELFLYGFTKPKNFLNDIEEALKDGLDVYYIGVLCPEMDDLMKKYPQFSATTSVPEKFISITEHQPVIEKL